MILKSYRSQPIENYKRWERSFQMFDYKDVKFPFKIRDIHKIEKKKNSISISVFGYKSKPKHPIYVSKKFCEEKHVDLLLIR